MNTLHLYHVSRTDLGNDVLLVPYIPQFATSGEDETIKRVCCCINIPDCIKAMETVPCDIENLKSIDLWVYESDVDINYIFQPNSDLLPDVWQTGELWITKPYMFHKIRHYICSKQFHIPNTNLSRYAFTADDEEYEIADRVVGTIIYGDINSFSMIMEDIDTKTWDEARKYYEAHPYF